MKRRFLLLTTCLLASGYLMAQSSRSSDSNTRGRDSHSSANQSTFDGIIELTDYPIYQDTGNKKQDDANHEIAKRKWFAENHNGPISARYRKGESAVWDFENQPGFPKYISTGDAEADKTNFNAAIREWFKNNPSQYKHLKGKK